MAEIASLKQSQRIMFYRSLPLFMMPVLLMLAMLACASSMLRGEVRAGCVIQTRPHTMSHSSQLTPEDGSLQGTVSWLKTHYVLPAVVRAIESACGVFCRNSYAADRMAEIVSILWDGVRYRLQLRLYRDPVSTEKSFTGQPHPAPHCRSQ